MRKPSRPKKARQPSMPAVEDATASLNDHQQAVLDSSYRESLSAFTQWEAARTRTDKQLYHAIGKMAEFVAAVGNDQGRLFDFAVQKGFRATKASSIYAVVAKLVVTDDRRKASKYATVLQLAAREGVETKADTMAAFIETQGGIEACVRRMRELAREGRPTTNRGRKSAFSQAIKHIAGIGRSQAPAALRLQSLPQDYVLIVGVRGEDGALKLLHEPVTEDAIVRKAISTLRPKD